MGSKWYSGQDKTSKRYPQLLASVYEIYQSRLELPNLLSSQPLERSTQNSSEGEVEVTKLDEKKKKFT